MKNRYISILLELLISKIRWEIANMKNEVVFLAVGNMGASEVVLPMDNSCAVCVEILEQSNIAFAQMLTEYKQTSTMPEKHPNYIGSFSWLYARDKGKQPVENMKGGKWMLFVPRNELDTCWKHLVEGIHLGLIEEIKTSIPNELNPRNAKDTFAIMVYTKDYSDIENVEKVLRYIEGANLTKGKTIYYKTNEATKKALYSGGKERAWLYNSNSFN